MRIGFNASIVDSILSGLGVYAINLLEELLELHDDLVVYTSCSEVSGVKSTKVRKISSRVQPRQGQKGHIHRLIWLQTALPVRVLADRATLLLSPLPEGMLFPVVPQAVVVHDVLPLRFPDEYPRQQYYFRYLVPSVLRRSAAIIADSDSTAQDIKTFYRIESTRVHVVPAGYDRDLYKLGIDSDTARRNYGLERFLFYVGNLLPHKNIRRLLQAFALIARRVPHTLVIGGRKDARYYPGLEAEAKALGLEHRVLFLDYVPLNELPALYAGAELFVLPSLYEGFGLPALEAMACGTPVVTSCAGSIPEVTGDAAVLFDPHDVQEMAGAIEKVVGDPGMREAMRQKGLQRAEQFGWSRTARMVLEILDAVARR